MTGSPANKPILPGKITPPEPGVYFQRSHLMQTLSELIATVRKVWISSPGGAGKTSLVRACLTEDSRPLVWYYVDDEDQDPAALFYYLSRTTPDSGQGGKLQPQFTAEYLPNPTVFYRNYFRTYFARFEKGCVLVFDDMQAGPGEAFFGPVLKAAMAELPANSALLLLSREEPFPLLARERLNRSMAHLGWDDLRLTADETRSFLSWALPSKTRAHDSDRAYDITQGWLAGLLLFLENPAVAAAPQRLSVDRADLLFDYFAEEIFNRLAVETQSFLLTCSVLPSLDADMLQTLTGRKDAGDLLRELIRGNHFTFRYSTTPETYRLHPLFRQFLQVRAGQDMEKSHLDEIRVRAARLLCTAGQTEATADLLIAVQDWPALIELSLANAETLFRQGRTRTLRTWLEALPVGLSSTYPWLCYWHGCCVSVEDPQKGKEDLAKAFNLFEAADDATGSMLAWAGMVYAIVVGWNELDALDEWVTKFYRLCERYPHYPSPEIEAQMVQAIFQALTWRQPSHPDMPGWGIRLHQLVTASSNRSFRILAGADLGVYYTVVGDPALSRTLNVLLAADLQSDEVTPLQKLIWFAVQATVETYRLDHPEGFEMIDAGRRIIAESGIHVADVRLIGSGIVLALSSDNLPLARQLFVELKATPIAAALDQAYFHYLAADLACVEGRLPEALALAEIGIVKAEAAGTPILLALMLAVSAMILHQTGQHERARGAVTRGLAISQGMKYFECYFNLLSAFFLLEEGQTAAAHSLLRKYIGQTARHNLNLHPWRSEIMGRLCREAINADIEVEYVRRLANYHQLDIGQPVLSSLTPKEAEILTWVKEGKTNWEIAQIQNVSERTIKFHVGNILKKLGASTRAHAVSIASVQDN